MKSLCRRRLCIRATRQLINRYPPLVVTDGDDANITITLQPREWFRNRDRSLFNPRRLMNDNQLRARFRQLVRATLRAFEDGNRNGADDRDTD